MNTPIDFYFDFSSPYSYIASEWIDALAARHGRPVRWQAILLGATFATTGLKPPVEFPLKREYSMRDFLRSARFEGLPYQQPQPFPIATQNAARVFWWLDAEDPARAVAWAHAALRAYFERPRQQAAPERRQRSRHRHRRLRCAVFRDRRRAVLG
jgi:2-hydroxychromene-2-carboxylate isomerase